MPRYGNSWTVVYRVLLSLGVLCIGTAVSVHAQNTTVTGTIVDSDTTPWASAIITATLQNPSHTIPPVYTRTGLPVVTSQTVVASGAGVFSFTAGSQNIADNLQISPSGTTWVFTLASNTSAPPIVLQPVVVTGASEDITALINAQLVAPRFAPVFNTTGYTDIEAANPIEGSSYLNVTTGFQRLYHAGAWINLGGGASGGGGTPILPLTQTNVGNAMLMLTDSTGPGAVNVSLTNTPPPVSCSGSAGQLYLNAGVSPYQWWNCPSSNVWTPGFPRASSSSIVFQTYNQQSPRLATADYPYPGTPYSNNAGIINTGNAACGDIFAIEGVSSPIWGSPPDVNAVTYFFQEAYGTSANWGGGSIGWGNIGNGPVYEQGCVTNNIMWFGTPVDAKYTAQKAALSGAWTAFNETTFTTTGNASSGSTALTVTSATGLGQYFYVSDSTNPAALAAGTYIESPNPVGTSILLSTKTLASIAGDTLVFTDPTSGPWISGVGECGTSGSLTWNVLPASGSVYISWLVTNGGTATANLSIDGTFVQVLSSGVVGALATVHETQMWFGQRFALTGTGTHTIVISPTAGSFCPLFAVTPSPSSWYGMSQPKVVHNIASNIQTIKNQFLIPVQRTAINQAALDGFNVSAADLNTNQPENYGGSGNYELGGPGCYPQTNLCSLYADPPHWTDLGNWWNGIAFVNAAAQVPYPPPNVVDIGTGFLNVTQTQSQTRVGLITTLLALLNQPNTFTKGPNTFVAGNGANSPVVIQGSAAAVTTPTPFQSFSLSPIGGGACQATGINMTAGDAVVVIVNSNNVIGTGAMTLTTSAGDNIAVTSSSPNWLPGPGSTTANWTAVYAGLIGGSGLTFTITNTGSGVSCNGGGFVWEFHNVNPTTPVDSFVWREVNGVVPPIITIGPVTLANSGDYLWTFQTSGCGGGPGTGWTVISNPPFANCQYSYTAASPVPPGNYTANWVPSNIGVGSDQVGWVLGLNGKATSGQTADYLTVKNISGTPIEGINNDAAGHHWYDSSCSAGQVLKCDGTGGVTIAAGNFTCTYTGSVACGSGTTSGYFKCTNGTTTAQFFQVTPTVGTVVACTLPTAFPTSCDFAQGSTSNGGGTSLADSSGAQCVSTNSVNIQTSNSSLTEAVQVWGH